MKLAVVSPRCWLLWFVIETVIAGFVSRRYTADETEAATFLAGRIRAKYRDNEHTKRKHKPEEELETKDLWYLPIDITKDRFDAVGKLFIVPIKARKIDKTIQKNAKTGKILQSDTNQIAFEYFDEFEYLHCSAFYVAPKILATAAHCLRNNGVTVGSLHVLLFRKQYDGTQPYDDDIAREHERVITEWIYIDSFNNAESSIKAGAQAAQQLASKEGRATVEEPEPWDHASGFDIAFLRTNDQGDGQKSYYELKSPENVMPKPPPAKKQPVDVKKISSPTVVSAKKKEENVVMANLRYIFGSPPNSNPSLLTIGYPQEYADWFQAAGVECSLATGFDDLVIKDKGIERSQKNYQSSLKSIAGNQVFCVGTKGKMGVGGSGGPWFLDENFVEEAAKKDKDKEKKIQQMLRWVVGVNSWGPARILHPDAKNQKKDYKDSQSFYKVIVSPWIRPQAIEMYEIVKKASLEDKPLLDALTAGLKISEPPKKK